MSTPGTPMDAPNPHGRQCTARSKRTGERCRRPVTPGRTTCRMHGGKTPRGPAAPSFRHGRYSTVLPHHLWARYEMSLRDPELLDLTSEIALVDARLADLLQRALTGESSRLWTALQQAARRFGQAQSAGDVAEMKVQLYALQGLIEQGAADTGTWQEIDRVVERRRKLAETERKRREALQTSLTPEQAMVFVGVVADAVRRHVTDRQALAAISAEVEALLRRTPGGLPAPHAGP